jgi:hypothetical protein
MSHIIPRLRHDIEELAHALVEERKSAEVLRLELKELRTRHEPMMRELDALRAQIQLTAKPLVQPSESSHEETTSTET